MTYIPEIVLQHLQTKKDFPSILFLVSDAITVTKGKFGILLSSQQSKTSSFLANQQQYIIKKLESTNIRDFLPFTKVLDPFFKDMFMTASLESQSQRNVLCPVVVYMPKWVNIYWIQMFQQKIGIEESNVQCTTWQFVYHILVKYVNLLFNFQKIIEESFQQCP